MLFPVLLCRVKTCTATLYTRNGIIWNSLPCLFAILRSTFSQLWQLLLICCCMAHWCKEFSTNMTGPASIARSPGGGCLIPDRKTLPGRSWYILVSCKHMEWVYLSGALNLQEPGAILSIWAPKYLQATSNDVTVVVAKDVNENQPRK